MVVTVKDHLRVSLGAIAVVMAEGRLGVSFGVVAVRDHLGVSLGIGIVVVEVVMARVWEEVMFALQRFSCLLNSRRMVIRLFSE
jgi:hypothetical protein